MPATGGRRTSPEGERRRARAAPRAPKAPPEVAEFLAYLSAECGLAENTCTAYRRDLERFQRFASERSFDFPDGIDRAAIQDFLRAEVDANAAVTSRRRRLSSLRGFFRYLVADGRLPRNPVRDIETPKKGKPLPATLSLDAVERIIAAAGQGGTARRDTAIIELLYSTGLRVSELCGLSIGDIREEDGFLRCLGKGGKERLVPIGDRALAAIARYRAEERPESRRSALFLSVRGKPLTRETVGRILGKAQVRAGVRGKVSPHTLRHSFATHLLDGGAGLREVQEMLGHADIRTTEIYTHIDHRRLKTTHREFHPRG